VSLVEGLALFVGEGHHERPGPGHQSHAEQVHRHLGAGEDRIRLAEVALGLRAQLVFQGKEGLRDRLLQGANVFADRALRAREEVLVPQPLKDAVRRVPLFPGALLVLLEPQTDHVFEGPQHRAGPWDRQTIPRRGIGRGKILGDGVARYPQPFGDLPDGPVLNELEFADVFHVHHVEHPFLPPRPKDVTSSSTIRGEKPGWLNFRVSNGEIWLSFRVANTALSYQRKPICSRYELYHHRRAERCV